MPKTNYNDAAFWQQKYKTTACEAYQWICKPETIFTALSQHLDYNSMDKVMQIGCGTSSFCRKLKIQIDARKKQVQFTCIDFSKQLIKNCRKKRMDLQSANFICADVRDLKALNQEQFDYVFDKGCIDCLFCEDNFIKQVLKAMIQCYKVLKIGGKFIIISHGKPKHRVYLFRNKLVPFSLQYILMPKTRDSTTQVYAYICTKTQFGAQNPNQDQQGKVLSEHQKSDDEKQQKKNKKQKEQIQNEKKKKQELNRKQKQKQKEKKKKNELFILDNKNNKESKEIKSDDEPKFILDNSESKQANKIEKHKQQPNFILQDGNDEGQDQGNIKQDNQQHQQQQQQQQQQQHDQEQEEQQEKGQEEKQEEQENSKIAKKQSKKQNEAQVPIKKQSKEEQGNFILKQAQYENDFDQI